MARQALVWTWTRAAVAIAPVKKEFKLFLNDFFGLSGESSKHDTDCHLNQQSSIHKKTLGAASLFAPPAKTADVHSFHKTEVLRPLRFFLTFVQVAI